MGKKKPLDGSISMNECYLKSWSIVFPSDLENLFNQDGLWIDLLKRQFVYKMETKKMAPEVKTANVMIKTFDDPKHDELTIDAVNMETDDWVFACKATTVYKVRQSLLNRKQVPLVLEDYIVAFTLVCQTLRN